MVRSFSEIVPEMVAVSPNTNSVLSITAVKENVVLSTSIIFPFDDLGVILFNSQSEIESVSNPSVINGPVCFSSPKIHDDASDRNFVMNMFRRSIEDQIIDFKYYENDGQSGVHEVHHKDTTFINLMLGFADQVMKIHSRVDFESYIRPFGKYYPSDGARFDKDNIKGMAICEAFREYHKKNAKLELINKGEHRQETSEEIKFNTRLRNMIKESTDK